MNNDENREREDDSLQEQLRDLLARHEDRDSLPAAAERLATTEREAAEVRSWLESLGVAAATSAAAAHPAAIGPYRILGVLGQGGMGVVYLAEQVDPVRRRVAIKLVKLGMDTRAVVARFEHERQALALMQHDGIAKVYDCGTTERGQPYFVMEVVEGVPLHRYCEQHRLPVRDRIVLLQQVCAAVTHAHQKGVVHRDLKPGNVLVHETGGKPQVKVIDFGLAKAIGENLADASMFTEAGRVVGTPEYMAPEQADPTNRDIDTRADVYSLGVMLYELLVGSLPFATAELRRAGAGELRRVLAEIETPRPSLRLAGDRYSSLTIAAARRTTPSSLQRELRSDLDWVVLKAIEKDRDRRYDSAQALADELQRYLDREPLRAGPPSTGYRLKKFVSRNRGAVAAVAAVLVTASLGTVVATQFALAARDSELLASQKAEEALVNEKLATERASENERLATSLRQRIKDSEMLITLANYQQVADMNAVLYPGWPDKIRVMESWIPFADMTLGIYELQRASEQRQSSATDPSAKEDASTTYLRESLRQLQPKLERLATIERPAMARRLAWANALAGMARGHPLAKHGWAGVRAAIAINPCYAGCSIDLADDDVFDLVPIGENPVTHLWEFYHLRSAWDGEADPRTIPIPEIRPDGSITMTPSTGIVFVLLPGGTFWMGAQGTDESGRNFDRDAAEDERLHAVTLPPFFLARHELTRGQWSRLAGTSPSWAPEGAHADEDPDAIGALHPAESISWLESNSWLGRYGLRLPTEAEWEYGCRGGTSTPWWSGKSPADLQDCANILDRRSGPRRSLPTTPPSPTEDPYRHLAPVGRFRANPFGLFDVHGNVWEWCQEPGDRYDPSAQLSYWVEMPGDRYRVCRGGSAQDAAGTVRSSGRLNNEASVTYNLLGLRAARSLHPR